eukprot:RCo046076
MSSSIAPTTLPRGDSGTAKGAKKPPRKGKKGPPGDGSGFREGSKGSLPAFFEDGGGSGSADFGELEPCGSPSSSEPPPSRHGGGVLIDPMNPSAGGRETRSEGASPAPRLPAFDLPEALDYLQKRWEDAMSYSGLETHVPVGTPVKPSKPPLNVSTEMLKLVGRYRGEEVTPPTSTEEAA